MNGQKRVRALRRPSMIGQMGKHLLEGRRQNRLFKKKTHCTFRLLSALVSEDLHYVQTPFDQFWYGLLKSLECEDLHYIQSPFNRFWYGLLKIT